MQPEGKRFESYTSHCIATMGLNMGLHGLEHGLDGFSMLKNNKNNK